MNKTIVVILLAFFANNLQAQSLKGFDIRIDVARFAIKQGLLPYDYYTNKISVLNGLRVGYQSPSNLYFEFGARRINSKFPLDLTTGVEDVDVSGVELIVAIKLSPGNKKKFFLSYGIDLFQEFSGLKGDYYDDVAPYIRKVDHKRRYSGIAPCLGFNFKLTDKIKLIAETRMRYGRLTFAPKVNSISTEALYSYGIGRESERQFDPLNALSIQFSL